MLNPFTRYFLRRLFFSADRGGLLLLAACGLAISSFALIVVQSTMGGLQRGLVSRSKRVLGGGVFVVHEPVGAGRLPTVLRQGAAGFRAVAGYELELVAKSQKGFSPAVVHGVDDDAKPPFLEGFSLDDLLVPFGLAHRAQVGVGDSLSLISAAHVDSLAADVPRSSTGRVARIFSTGVVALDEFHLWARLGLVQNLVMQRRINTVRFYGDGDIAGLAEALRPFAGLGEFSTWSQDNATLAWALALEMAVMVFLFSAMALLVSLCVTGGLAIFFDKIRVEMVGLWILGTSRRRLRRAGLVFLVVLGALSSGVGLLSGIAFLEAFDRYAPEILPHIFVDRKIPVHITASGCALSFAIPFAVSVLFGCGVLRRLRDLEDRRALLRSMGR